MKKEAYAESTMVATGKRLRHLAKNCNLENPENVKGFIAQKSCSPAFKESLVEAFDIYCKASGLSWNKPFYERYDRGIKIPTEEKLNMIIADSSRRLGLALSIIRDLGLRPIELTWLRLRDGDLESGAVQITSAKHCAGRSLKMKSGTLTMLKAYVTFRKIGLNDRLFAIKSSSLSESYRIVRNRLAEKLGDPSFKTIRLYDFRHFKASMEYHRTKDLFHVKAVLGHTDLRTTLKYIHLEGLQNDDYVCKAAKSLEECSQLIEAGFEYVTDLEGVKLFRKRR